MRRPTKRRLRRRSPSSGRVIATLLGGLMVGCATPVSAATSHSSAPAFMVTRDCQEEQAFVDGDASAVAHQLPRRYSAVRDPLSDAPVLFFRGERCGAVTVNGATAPATMASFGVLIQTPDGTGCASAAPGVGSTRGDVPPVCNWYTLGWLTSSRGVLNWFHAGVAGFPASYAPRLDFQLGAFDPRRAGAPFRLSVPPATDSPFAMNAITRQRPGQLPVRGGYWSDTPQGVVKVVFASDDLTSGDASGVVSAPTGSRVATLLGANQRPYLPGYSGVSAEHWDQAVYRQEQPGPASNTTSFAGSCSMQGTVTFDPPATNTAQALAYAYASKGSCSGVLDGRSISNAPATLQQSGASYGSCSHAQTTMPGRGTIGFSGDKIIAMTMDFNSVGTEVNETIYGDRSGMAPARGTFLTPRTSPDIIAQCAGSGARFVPMDLTFTTETPLVSGDGRSSAH